MADRVSDNVEGWFARFLIVCLFVPLVVLILGDRSVWSWDLGVYGQQSVELYNTLLQSPGAWVEKMLVIGYDRPVAIAWVGQFFVPLGRSINSVQSGLLFLTLVTCLSSTLLLLNSLQELFGRRWVAVLSCVFVVTGPLFVGLGFRYYVEPLQGLAVVWLVAVVAFHERLSRLLLACHAVAAAMFGLAIKPTTGFFQAPLLLYVAYLWWHMPKATERRSNLLRAYLAAMTVATMLLAIATLVWYVLHYRYVMEHVVEASAGLDAEHYGIRAPWLVKVPFWFRELQRNFCAVFLLPYLGLLFVIAVFNSRSWRRAASPATVLVGIALGWIVVTVAVFALNVNDHSRYLMALFPYVGIVVCWILVKLRSGMGLGLFAGLCGLQFILVLAQASGYISPLEQFSGYLDPWKRSSSGLETVYFAVDRTCEAGSVSAVGVQLPDFNEQALSFYAAIRHPGTACSYFGLPVHETQLSAEEVWARLNRQPFRYYLYRRFTDAGEYEWLNKFSRVMLANIEESPTMWARPDKSNAQVVVLERSHAVQPGDRVMRGVAPDGKLPFGYLEEPAPGGVFSQEVPISGWLIMPAGLRRVDACFNTGGEGRWSGCQTAALTEHEWTRTDVAGVYPSIPAALKSGFRGAVNIGSVPKGRYQMALVVHGTDGSAREIASIPVYVKPFVRDSGTTVFRAEEATKR